MIAQQGGRDLPGIGGALNELHAVLPGVFLEDALAAPAGVNLGLDHGQRSAEGGKCRGGFLGVAGDNASWHRHARVAENLLGLEFVNFHTRSGNLLWPAVRA